MTRTAAAYAAAAVVVLEISEILLLAYVVDVPGLGLVLTQSCIADSNRWSRVPRPCVGGLIMAVLGKIRVVIAVIAAWGSTAAVYLKLVAIVLAEVAKLRRVRTIGSRVTS